MEVLILAALLMMVAPILAIVAMVWTSRLDRRLREIQKEIWSLKDRVGAAPSAEPAPPSPPSPPVRPHEPGPPLAAGVPVASFEPAAPQPALPEGSRPGEEPPPIFTPSAAPRGADSALEARIGTRWFNVAGIITLLFGVAFFLKYAYENAWIGPRGRVAIGVASGIAAVLLGEATRRRGHRVFSQGLSGGGIAAVYLSFFFSFRFYRLIEIAPAFGLMAAVTACGIALALVQDSIAVAFLSFLGAYLTPVLLSTGQDAAEFLFAYLTVLALGALAVTYFKRWRALDILAFAATCFLYAGWYDAHYRRERLGVAIAGLAVFFVIFLLVPYGHNLARRLVTGPGEHLLALANAAFTFGFLYRMIYPISPSALGFIALALAACYLALGSLARRRLPADRNLTISILGISITFLTLAIPLHLGLHGITLAWAAQGLVIVYLGFRYNAFLTRLAGLAVIGLSVIRLFLKHTPLHSQPFTIFWNHTFGTWAMVVAAILAAGWLYRRQAGRLDPKETALPSGTLVSGLLLLFVGLNEETRLYFKLWSRPEDHLAGAVMLLWSVFPLCVLASGRLLRDRAISVTAMVLTLLSVVPFLSLTGRVMASADPLFGSFVFWMGMLGVASFFAASAWHRRLGDTAGIPLEAPLSLARLFAGASGLLLLMLLTAEVHSHYLLQPGAPDQMATNALRALMAVSVLWAIFASVLMALGFRWSDRHCRYAAAGLFTLTLAKVFAIDVWELREVYRIVSFVILGMLLVAASFLYSRFRSRIAMVAIGTLLALAAAGEARADFQSEQWKLVREIHTAGIEGPFAWIILDEEILGAARADLVDLRVVGRDRLEVPWVLRVRRGGTEVDSYAPRLLNRAARSGGAVSVELDFGQKVLKNFLEVDTGGESFRRRVMVEGSEEGLDWVTVVDDAWIYRMLTATRIERGRFDSVELPQNDHRRLRVTVFPMPEEKDPINLIAVRARRKTIVRPETAPLKIAMFHMTQDPNTKTSIIDIDFGYRHARPALVDLDFKEEAFRRPYRMAGRNEERMVVHSGMTETGDPIRKEVEAPWQTLALGVLFRLPPGRRGEASIDQTDIELPQAIARYLRVRIEDQDNRPLTLRGIRAEALVHRIVFPVRASGAYSLYYGNQEASRPAYDLAALLPDLDARPPASARLGPPGANPLHPGAPQRAFTERHPWLLWVVLLAAVAILALVLVRNIRALPRRGAL